MIYPHILGLVCRHHYDSSCRGLSEGGGTRQSLIDLCRQTDRQTDGWTDGWAGGPSEALRQGAEETGVLKTSVDGLGQQRDSLEPDKEIQGPQNPIKANQEGTDHQ